MYSTLLIFPPMSGKYIPKKAIETVTMARIVTSDLSFASIVVPPRMSTRNSQAPTGPLRDVTFFGEESDGGGQLRQHKRP
jgi:hypothetical protein